ncbi:F0F1 ATP synthase subunit epsilon [Terrilactibacillus laevilacticus]|uniref:ATP synthase epsilon chain n=1 Tax=Terrilactibacillus laevilacticus TaxID=1380157 RepID=A0ABW5PN00_9BACI|nr:F0F1 ATP synthase subunit epsilon [Terrilactibacillus laevilacticus]
MSTVHTEIVTPNGKIFEGEAHMINVRATSGELGILPKHMPLVAPLEIDRVRLDLDDRTQYVAVHGGFIQIHPEHVTILSESAELKEDIDVPRAEKAKVEAEGKLDKLERGTLDYETAKKELKRAEARLKTAKSGIE